MAAGLLVIYGVAIVWSVLACLGFIRNRTWPIVLGVHVAASVLLAVWLISLDLAVGMAVIMFGPGAVISLAGLIGMAFGVRRGH